MKRMSDQQVLDYIEILLPLDENMTAQQKKNIIRLQEDMKSVLAEYQDVDCKVKELEKQKTGLANQIKAAMGEYETGEVDGTVVSWKKISRESLDSKRLRKEQPEVFAEYSNISSYRKLSIA